MGFFLGALVAAALLVHGSLYGLTDDEAYYWVLSKTPLLGYAYHPPAVAWIIGFFETIFSPVRSFVPLEMIVRMPAFLVSGLLVWFASRWLEKAGVPTFRLKLSTLTFIAFPGLFGISWMMVPDVPLLAGWILVFLGTWSICFSPEKSRYYAMIFFGAMLAMVSKIAGVFILISSVLCLLVWSFSGRRKRALFALLAGAVVGLAPFIVFNWQHGFGPILYQLQERHQSGSFSLARFARFWLILAVGVGPVLVAWFFVLPFRAFKKDEGSIYLRVSRFTFFWVLPSALVFCFQPLFAEFKPHWVLLAWLPVGLWLSYNVGLGRDELAAKIQRVYGFSLLILVFILCHLPIGNLILSKIQGPDFDRRLDVTSDAYGWDEWAQAMKRIQGDLPTGAEVIGSRYQTAAQASYALKKAGILWSTARVPRSEKEFPEWPNLRAIETPGPDWPTLRTPVFYVLDHRYDQRPMFPNASCKSLGRVSVNRQFFGREIPAKWIETFYCEP